MPTPVEVAVDNYIRLWSEPDPARRAVLIEACFAADGRLVTGAGVIRGRAALAEAVTRFLADPQWRGIRIVSAIDARGTTFRFGAVAERHDGTSAESFDAGEIDADGRIAVLLTFNGRLAYL
jgi:hypothetical protein